MKYFAAALGGTLIGAVAAYFFFTQSMSADMVAVHTSTLGFDETVVHIEQQVAEKGWKMPKVYDLQKSLAQAGYDVPRITVFSMCNPHHANKLLSKDDTRFVAAMMPCRVAVYEHDGGVRIAAMNVAGLSGMFGGIVEDVMTDVADEQVEMLRGILAKE